MWFKAIVAILVLILIASAYVAYRGPDGGPPAAETVPAGPQQSPSSLRQDGSGATAGAEAPVYKDRFSDDRPGQTAGALSGPDAAADLTDTPSDQVLNAPGHGGPGSITDTGGPAALPIDPDFPGPGEGPGDSGVMGPAPEASDTGVLGPAPEDSGPVDAAQMGAGPEDSQPGSIGLAPEASGSGIIGPAPEDSGPSN